MQRRRRVPEVVVADVRKTGIAKNHLQHAMEAGYRDASLPHPGQVQ